MAEHLVPWLRGSEGSAFSKGQSLPNVLHSHLSQPWCPCWHAQPLLSYLLPQVPPLTSFPRMA